MATEKQEAALMKADSAALTLEGMRANLNDPRGYGNAFVDVWNWLKGKFKRG